ncbi:IS110 family transposase [Persephonella sp. IF05-L8]|uniref:IS110 family transposase n=1 Tax=Persephonella sp. IF05-L8 TaxID=1158338 RepID=UPI000496E716
MKYFIGLDIDSKNVQIAVIDTDKKIYTNKKIKGIELINFVKNEIIGKFSPKETLVAMESTSSSYHLYPNFVFKKFGYTTKIVNPIYIKRYREYKTFRGKKQIKLMR